MAEWSALKTPARRLVQALLSENGFQTVQTGADRVLEALHQFTTTAVGGPSFLVVGGVKCGTYSLYEYLKFHPRIAVPRKKELGYFANDRRYPDPDWYRQQFRVRPKDKRRIRASGEFTPSYCFSPCIERIHAFNPEIKLIMMVRNPIARAVSQYHMYRKKGMENRPIEQAILADNGERPHISHAYLSRGRYHEQLVRMHQYFPPHQILVQRLEDLAQTPQAVMDRITGFLGLPPLQGVEYRAYNVGRYAPIPSWLEEKLRAYFAPFNQKLHADFGVRIDDWE